MQNTEEKPSRIGSHTYITIKYGTVRCTVQTCHVTVLRLEAVTWTLAAATPAVLMATQVYRPGLVERPGSTRVDTSDRGDMAAVRGAGPATRLELCSHLPCDVNMGTAQTLDLDHGIMRSPEPN